MKKLIHLCRLFRAWIRYRVFVEETVNGFDSLLSPRTAGYYWGLFKRSCGIR